MNISIPSNLVSEIASSTTSMIASLSGVTTFLIGILLAFFVLHLVITLVKGNDLSENRNNIY